MWKVFGTCFSLAVAVVLLYLLGYIGTLQVNPDTQARNFTLQVVNKRGHGASGVGWDSNRVLTAAHVIRGNLSDYIVKQGDRAWSITGARYISDRDAVLLTIGSLLIDISEGGRIVEWSGPIPVPERGLTMSFGESVLVGSHPWGGPIQVSHGVVTGRNKYRLWTYMMDADINFGSSGGPVFDSEGKLIGIIVGMSTGKGPAFSVALPITEVLSGLERPNTGREGSIVGRGRDHRDGIYRLWYSTVPR